ncbi:hypothetical protein [Gymnodinialimonas hymeniacidonis]|uniref:hypothetical protein n=1 Tax=Gymnodinialimonas hymeniacidonis TaxID=3126508 RepID=UPI0034C679DE
MTEELGLSDVQHSDGLSITLSHASPDAPWVPVALVISKPEHRHRITFTTERPLDEVFCPEISDRIMAVLDEFSRTGSDGVFSNPDEEIQLPGLSLRQLRVLYSHFDDQPNRALVRFAAIAGNPHRALKSEDGFSYPLEALTSQVYRDALDWVLLPAINAVAIDDISILTEDQETQLEAAMDQLRVSKDRLLFQVELVKRELTRLESRAYSKQLENRPLRAAEPAPEEFRTMKALRRMDD